MKRITSLVLFAAMVGCLAVSAWGQQVTAAFTGKVTDPSGAAVVGAKVSAIDADRGTPWTTTTNGEGVFNIPRVPIGTYNVKVEKDGFQTATQSHLAMEMNQVARLDFQLQVGSLSQSVEVVSAEPLLQTQGTELGQTIDARTNEDLPLATRNYVQLTLLAPGSIHPDPSSFKNGQTTMNSGRPNVNGNREQANNFMLDGLDNNQVSENDVGYAPSVDAIQEFNEITNNAPAEFGNFMGAIISTTTKSGTNQFHGSAFEFFRNNVLNANDWSNNFNGAPRAAIRWNNFGGTLGGPIKKDKLFFFIDYQGSRDDTPTSIQTTSLFTAAERQGNFSQLLSLGSPIQLYNPFSVNSAGNRAPFAGNIIPASLFSPAAAKILTSQYYPAPINSGLVNNYQYAQNTFINGDQGDVKIDYNISDKDRFYLRFSESRYDNPSINTLPLIYNSFSTTPTHTGVMDWTRTISPSLVNEVRFGVNYVYNSNGAAGGAVSGFGQTVGIPGVPSAFLPAMNFQGGNAATIGNSDIYQLFADTVIHYEDTIIWTKGKHTMHIGFQGYRYRIDTFYSGNNGEAGTFNFNGQYTTSSTTTKSGNGSGLAEADFLLGLPSEIQGGVNGGTWGQRSNSVAAFFQDDWRVTSNLTFNLGLRWELHTPWDEVKNRQANFDLVTGQEYLSGQSCPYNNCNALYNQYNGITNFQPRIGAAWTPGGGKLVVRAGYTMSNYLEGTGTNLRLPINPPFAHENDDQYTNSALFGVKPGSTLDQGFLPFSQSCKPVDWRDAARLGSKRPSGGVESVEPESAISTELEHHCSGQLRRAARHAPYGSDALRPERIEPGRYRVAHQISRRQSNAAERGRADLRYCFDRKPGLRCAASAGEKAAGCGPGILGGLYILQVHDQQYGLLRPRRPSLAKATGTTRTSTMQRRNGGPATMTPRQNFVANAVYDIPFGRGRTFGNNMNKALDAVVGGWKMAGILSLHTGFPLTIGANDASNTTSRGPRADCISPVDILGTQNASPSVGDGYQWFNPSAFAQPANGTFGSCGVGTVRGPGLTSLDFNVSKTFKIHRASRRRSTRGIH